MDPYTWIYLIIAVVVSVALAPKPPKPKPASLEDFDIPTAEEGRPVPVVFGTVRITGPNVLWYGDLGTRAMKKSSLFSKTTIGYKYYMGLHFGICHGPVDAITKIECGEKTAWSGSVTTNSTIAISQKGLFGGKKREGGLVGYFDVMFGEPTQAANSYLDTTIGYPPGGPAVLGDITAFRGIMGLVWRGDGAGGWMGGLFGTDTGGYIGTTPYIKPFAFTVKRITKGWHNNVLWYAAKADISGAMNPAHIVYEALTNPEWGMGLPADRLEEADFTAAADTLYTEGFGMSIVWNQQATVEDFLGDVLNHCAGILGFDRTTGKYRLKLIRDDYNAATLPIYGPETLSGIDSFQRQAWGETVNELTLSYTDPVTLKSTAVTVHDLANVRAQGVRVAQQINYPGIVNHDIAQTVAMRELAARSTPTAKVTFRVNRDLWQTIGAEVFKISWPTLGISEVIVRVLKINQGTLANGEMTIDAVEDVFGLSLATYTAQPSPGTIDDGPGYEPDDEEGGPTVISATTTAPPGSPADGDSYLVPTGATGAWAGHDGEYATWDADEADWQFSTVAPGTVIYDSTAGGYVTGPGAAAPPWTPSPTTTLGDLIRRGASADERLAIGTDGQVLTVAAGVPTWADPTGGGGGDSAWLYVVALFKFEGADGATATTDLSSYGRTVNFVGTAQLDTAEKKFGSSSLLLDGTGDYLTCPDADELSIAAFDFTIEAWIRRASTGTVDTILNKRPSSSSHEYSFSVNSTDFLVGSAWTSGTVLSTITSDPVTIPADTWTHVAWTRSGNTWRLWINGTQVAETTAAGSASSTTAVMNIGHDGYDGTRDFHGWIDSLRFTRGFCRYDTNFTAPTEDFPTGLSAVENLNDLLDVDTAGVNDGDALVYDSGTSTWIPGTAGSTSPTTTQGDMIVRGASADERLPIGGSGSVLTVSGGVPTWAAPAGTEQGAAKHIVQAANLVIANDNVFQDTGLVVALEAGTYEFESFYGTDCHLTPDMEVQFAFTGTYSTVQLIRQAMRGTTTASAEHHVALPAVYLMNDTAAFSVHTRGMIVVTAPGNFKLQARQVTSSATAVTFKAGSWLSVVKTPTALGGELPAGMQFVVKASDQSITNQATYVDVDDIVVNVEAGKTYRFECFFVADSHVTPDLNVRLHNTAACSRIVWSQISNVGTTSVFGSLRQQFDFDHSFTTTATNFLRAQGTFVADADGQLKLQFKQVTSSATPVAILAGTYLLVEDVSAKGTPEIYVQATEPANPGTGALWFW